MMDWREKMKNLKTLDYLLSLEDMMMIVAPRLVWAWILQVGEDNKMMIDLRKYIFLQQLLR